MEGGRCPQRLAGPHGDVRHLADRGQSAAVLENLFIVLLKALPQVVGQVVLDVIGELIPELGVEPEHLQQLGHLDKLEEAVGEGPDIGTGLDNIGRLRDDQGNVASN